MVKKQKTTYLQMILDYSTRTYVAVVVFDTNDR
jgi:hypothetical protein